MIIGEIVTGELEGVIGVVLLVLLLVAAGLTPACVHPVVVVPILVPVVRWNLPLDADDDARFCVATENGPTVDPADVLPFRCVSVGAVRAWVRGQRLANE